MKLKVDLPHSDTLTIYDYTLSDLLSMVEKATGKELAELIGSIDYSIHFPNGESSFIFDND